MDEAEQPKLVRVPPEQRRKKPPPAPEPAVTDDSEPPPAEPEPPPVVAAPRALKRKAAAKPAAPPAPSLDHVVQRHLARDAQAESDLDEQVEQLARDPGYSGRGPVPPVESDPERRPGITMGEVAFTEDAGVPDFVENAQKPRTLEDLLAVFPVGDGQYRIRVERKRPKEWGGYPCAGIQKSIRVALTIEQFRRVYGGGEYVLTVYGPPKRGGLFDPATGRQREKALTNEVTLTLAWTPPYGVPPQPDAAFDAEEEATFLESEDDVQQPMRYGPGFRTAGQVNTPADAKMFEAQLLHEREMAARQEAREREAREEALRAGSQLEPLLDRVQNGSLRLFEMMNEREREKQAALEREREEERSRRIQLENEARARNEAERCRLEEEQKQARGALEAERAALATRPTPQGEVLTAVTHLMSPMMEAMKESLKPREDGKAEAVASDLRTQVASLTAQATHLNSRLESQGTAHSLQLQGVHDAHKSELTRLQTSYDGERQRERDAHEAAIGRERRMAEDQVARADRRATDAETRVTEMERRLEERIERVRVEERNTADKRVADAERILKDRMTDEQRNHERELRSLEATYTTRNTTEKSISDSRTDMLRGEVERERAEKERYAREATEKGDVVAQVAKVTEVAQQLGFSKEGGGEPAGDWKTMLLQMGLQLAQNLPDIITNAGEAVSKAKAGKAPPLGSMPMLPPGAPPMMLPGYQQQPAFQPSLPVPMPFGTEDGMPVPPTHMTHPAKYPTRPGAPQPVAAPAGPMMAPPMPMGMPTAPLAQPPLAAPPNQPAESGPLAQQMAPSIPPAAPAAPPPRRAPRPAPVAPPPLPEPAVPVLEIPPEQILMFRPAFEAAFAERQPPEQFARDLMETHGKDVVVAVGAAITPAKVTSAIASQPDGGKSPLVRREGQQYLKAIFAAVRQLGAQ